MLVFANCLEIIADCLVEEGAETLMQLGADESEPFLHAIPLDRAGRGCQPGSRLLIREVMHDGAGLR
jgi:hypothetical protein